MDPISVGLGDLGTFVAELHQQPLRPRTGTEHADISGGRSEQRADVLLVLEEVVGHHQGERALIDPRRLGCGGRFVDRHEAARLGEACRRQERRAIVDDGHVPTEHRRGPHQRDRVVPGAADDESERRIEHLDERADAVGQHANLRPLFPEEPLRRLLRVRVHRRIAERSVGRPVRPDHETSARIHAGM